MPGAGSTIANVIRRRPSWLLLTAIGALAFGFPHGGRPLRAATDDEADPALSSRLHRIEAAFRSGDANSLRLSFATRGKVVLDVKDIAGGQASYAPGQLQAIFRQVFEDSRTRDFSFGPRDVKVAGPDTAFARAHWVRHASGGPESVDTLTFTLREEGGDWRILEIRSSR